MRVLTDMDLLGLLSPAALVAVLESAVRAHDAGRAVTPARTQLAWEDGTLLSMPALAEAVFGTKLVCVIPANAARGLPVTNGLMVLSDRRTGAPLALLNAAALTAQRTGAIGALGVKYMTPADTASVGIIGAGVQGAWQAIFACAMRPIREVLYVARSPASGARFEATVRAQVPGMRLTPCLRCTRPPGTHDARHRGYHRGQSGAARGAGAARRQAFRQHRFVQAGDAGTAGRCL